MRLSEKELRAFRAVLGPDLIAVGAELFLFGSRADDRKRGGDIDLLILADAADVGALEARRVRWIDDLHSRIGEQRIDLTIRARSAMADDAFLKAIAEEMVRLPLEARV